MAIFNDVKSHELVTFLFKDKAEFLTGQKKGSSADYLIDNKYLLEVKFDKMAVKTGNIYVETENEKQGIRFPSGISLSAKHNYMVLFIVPKEKPEFYLVHAVKLLQHAADYGKLKKTRPWVNGNSDGFYGVGYVVPISTLQEFKLDNDNVEVIE